MMSTIRMHNPYPAATMSPGRRFRHNPYDLLTAVAYEEQSSGAEDHNSRSESPAAPINMPDFDATLHKPLIGMVNFEPFPQVSREPPLLHFTKADCFRLFIGQIPYGAPASQVEWMVFAATGRRVYFTETIQRWTGTRSPKGCAHTYCLPADYEAILRCLHRRLLVDDVGVWIAADEQQRLCLEKYCGEMKADKTMRFRDRPYQPMVVEGATSDFVPRRPSPPPAEHVPMAFPPEYDYFIHAETAVAPPPPPKLPSYNDLFAAF
jgi:hypothetical protein